MCGGVTDANSVKSPTQLDMFYNPTPWLEMGADFRFRENYGGIYVLKRKRARFFVGILKKFV